MKIKIKPKSKSSAAPSGSKTKAKLRLADLNAPTFGVTDSAKANRETYLENAVALFTDLFRDKGGVSLPAVRVSCGFPGGRGSKKILGACWDANAASDHKANIFISPLIDDTELVLATLAHELVHAVCGHDEGHGPAFKRLAFDIGLRGKTTATYAGESLTDFIRAEIVANIGLYPHAKLSLSDNPVKKQGTRMIKCFCKKSGYTVRTTKQWLDKYGAPISPVTQKPMAVEWPDEEVAGGKEASK